MQPRSATLPASIGRFRVDALLGSGGMGEVFKAFDPTLQRTVAVKTVRPDVERPDYLARLYREAQACARLQHPNIVTVYEAGEIDGLVYIAMEYLKGEDLAATLRRGELSFAEKVRILMQVLAAVQHAHNEDVIHRDIKPSNIQRLPDGTVKLMDFGLARMTAAEKLTVTGAVMATLHYASPEQLRGQALDSRTDLYSVGVVAYEMCAGRCPFLTEDDSVATIVLKVLSEAPPPMNVVWSRRFPEFEAIVMRAIAKSPDDRFQSADEMRNALGAFLGSSEEKIGAVEAEAAAAQTDPTIVTVPGAVTEGARTTAAPASPGLAPTAGRVAGDEPTLVKSPAGPALAGRDGEPTIPVTPRRPSKTMWWLSGAMTAAILVVAAVLMMRPSGASTTPTTTAAVDPPAVAEANQPLRNDGVANPATPNVPAASAPPPTNAAAPSVSALRAVPAATPPGPAPKVTNAATPPAVLGARQLFYGDNAATSGGKGPVGTSPAANAGLRYRLIKQTPTGEVEVDPDAVFHSGERVRFSFESNIDGYLYVVQQGSSGRWNLLFPNPRINGGKNAIQRFEGYQVPSSAWFLFDATPGTEQIFVYLSREPLAQLPGFDEPVTKTESLSASVVGDLKQSVQSRDLLIEDEGGKVMPGSGSSQAIYVVNRDELGKSVAATISLTHSQ